MFSNRRVPALLKVVASLFIFSGICAVLEIVLSLQWLTSTLRRTLLSIALYLTAPLGVITM